MTSTSTITATRTAYLLIIIHFDILVLQGLGSKVKDAGLRLWDSEWRALAAGSGFAFRAA